MGYLVRRSARDVDASGMFRLGKDAVAFARRHAHLGGSLGKGLFHELPKALEAARTKTLREGHVVVFRGTSASIWNCRNRVMHCSRVAKAFV